MGKWLLCNHCGNLGYYLISNVYDHATVAASPQSTNHTDPLEYEEIIINVKKLFHFKSLQLEIYGLLTTPLLALKKSH